MNISHQAIPTIGCSGMTVSIAIPDKAVLSTLKPGRQVDLDLRKLQSESYVIGRGRPLLR